MRKRILLAAGLMIAAMLTGCSTGASNTPQEPAEAQVEAVEEENGQESKDVSGEPVAASKLLEGKKVICFLDWPNALLVGNL